jgi:hypothetical protein
VKHTIAHLSYQLAMKRIHFSNLLYRTNLVYAEGVTIHKSEGKCLIEELIASSYVMGIHTALLQPWPNLASGRSV